MTNYMCFQLVIAKKEKEKTCNRRILKTMTCLDQIQILYDLLIFFANNTIFENNRELRL